MWISILEHMDPEATALFLKLHRGNISSSKPKQTGSKKPAIDVDTKKFNLFERFEQLSKKFFRKFTRKHHDDHDND